MIGYILDGDLIELGSNRLVLPLYQAWQCFRKSPACRTSKSALSGNKVQNGPSVSLRYGCRISHQGTDGLHHRALGTPLDWPQAKKNASHVREWGIQVPSDSLKSLSIGLRKPSNCFRYGIVQRAKSEMRCYGVMRRAVKFLYCTQAD